MPPKLPTRPTETPDKLSASWICELLNCVEYAMTNPRGDGKTIINESSGTLRALRQSGGGAGAESQGGEVAPVCKITGNSNAPEYSVEVYANGKYSPATGTGTLYVLDISYCERLLVGTWVIGHQSNMSATSAG